MRDIGERGRADENELSERVTAAAERSFDVRCQFSVIAGCGRKVTRWGVVVSIKDTVTITGTRRTSNVQAADKQPVLSSIIPRFATSNTRGWSHIPFKYPSGPLT